MSLGDVAVFPTTDWSLLAHASEDELALRQLSLCEVLDRYLPPMKRYLRFRWSNPDHQIEDWLQGFIADRILRAKLLSRAQRSRGRFRSFLVRALDNYVISELRKDTVRAMRNGISTDPVDLQEFEDTAPNDPALLFDRTWAEHVIARAVEETRIRCVSSNRGALWEVFRHRVLLNGAIPNDYKTLAQQFAFETPTQASTAMNTVKRIFARILKSILVEYGGPDADPDEEIRLLKQIFERSSAENIKGARR